MIDWQLFWKWICNIGSLASLIALPIALWQIFSIKKRMHNAKETTERYLAHSNREKLEMIMTVLNEEHRKIFQLKTGFNKKGSVWKTSQEQAEDILQGINKCIYKLPPECSDEEKQLRNVLEKLDDFIKCDEIERELNISEAESALHACIDALKQTKEHMLKKELQFIVNSD